MNISYCDGNEDKIIYVEPLWKKTNEYHRSHSPYFPEKFAEQEFKSRTLDLLEKSRGGQLKVILACDSDNDRYVGYCICIIDVKNAGKIESIFVESEYRRKGIAENLMNIALKWMNENSVHSKSLTVAIGNESVLNFYSKFGFFPYLISLEEKLK